MATRFLTIQVAPITVLLDTLWLARTALRLSPWYLPGVPRAPPPVGPGSGAGTHPRDPYPAVPDPSSIPAGLLPSDAEEDRERDKARQKEFLGIGDLCKALAMRVNGSHLREVKRGERSVGVGFGKFLLLVPCHPLVSSCPLPPSSPGTHFRTASTQA